MFSWGLAQLAGALLILWQPELPHPGFFFLSLPLVLALLARPRRRWLAAVWLGAALTAWQADRQLEQRLEPSLDGQIVTVTGRIAGLVERDARRQRFLFLPESAVDADGNPVTVPSRLRLNLYEHPPVTSGERWQWRAKLRRPRGFANPGGFDYERWLLARGIGATGYVYRPEESATRLTGSAGDWRASVADRVASLTQGEAAGLLRGLATGDRSAISLEQWEVLRRTGTAHLMAISGLHVGLVAGLGLGLAGLLRRRLRAESSLSWQPLFAAVMALAYGSLAGFSLPVRRALLGLAILLLALALRRRLAPAHAYGTALAGVLLLDPLAPLDTGFWLSFGAVAAILFLLAGRRPLGSRLHQAARAQAGLFVLLAPLLIAAFGELPLVSPLANAVAIPMFALLIVPGVLLALALLPWPSFAAVLFEVLGWMLEQLLVLLEWLAGLNAALTAAASLNAILLLAASGLLLCLPRALPGRAFALLLLVPAAWMLRAPAAVERLDVHFLDVGQGLAVVVETPRYTLVYDTGPRFGANDAAQMVVIPFLLARARSPDRIVVSHGDSDHAGGLGSLLERFPDTPVLGRTRDGEHEDCAGREWQWDGVLFQVLHPPKNRGGSSNDMSCVLLVQSGSFRLLLTGDAEAAAEGRLLAERGEALSATVVQVPHHGSRTSSTPAFVEAVAPELAVAGAGFGNRWGFPRPEVVKRWQDAGAEVLSTGEQGAISLRLRDDGYTVTRFRDVRRLWREPPGSLMNGK